MTRRGQGGDTGPTMVTTTTASVVGAEWVARPLAAQAPEGRWGIAHRPTGRWIAYGSEARCRSLAAQLAADDGGLVKSAFPATGAGGTAL